MSRFEFSSGSGRLLVLSILVLLMSVGCGGGAAAPEEAAEAPTPLVAVVTVATEEWRETVELTAELAPWAAVTVAAEVAGRVVELPVDHGDRVRAGQVIARLDTSATTAELAQAKARLQSALASLEQARRDLERGESLAEGDAGILSAEELDRLRLAFSTGEANQAEAAAAVEVVEQRLDKMMIRAPFAGTVSERQAEIGSWLGAGDPVIRLVDSARLKARGSASQTDRLRLDLEVPVSIRTDALPGQAFDGRLRYLGQEAEASTGTYLVEAEVPAQSPDHPGTYLLAGMRGSMTLELGRHQDLLLPRTALVKDAVFVVDGETAHRRAVETAAIGPGQVRVIAGLETGERVVVQGQHRLRDGVEVAIRSEDSGTPDAEQVASANAEEDTDESR